MKICIFGLWHLGTVTAACIADAKFNTIGIDEDETVIKNLSVGKAPLFEPGLEDLIQSGLASKHLTFSTDKSAIRDADLVWVTFDTPVDEDDRADVHYVINKICSLFPYLRNHTVVLVSSQLPVGTISLIEKKFEIEANGRQIAFACSPENLRLGKAIQVFRNPERIIVGLRNEWAKTIISKVFAPFSDHILWVGTEAAELTKHAINAFLATCVAFANEIATVSEKVGADAQEVELAMRSEPRIGLHAYIRPGAAFAGGTLARDVTFLSELAEKYGLPLSMINSILASNTEHGNWPIRKLENVLGNLSGREITVLGLSYKPGTDAIRRSLAVSLVRKMCSRGANVSAFDPAVQGIPDPPPNLVLARTVTEAVENSEAVVVMTEWPDFKSLTSDTLLQKMSSPNVLDQNRFLSHLSVDPRIQYFSIGRTS